MKKPKFLHRLSPVLVAASLLATSLPAAGAAGQDPAGFAKELSELVSDTHEDYFFGAMTLTLGSNQMELDGQSIAMDVAPMVDSATSRTLLPIRYVAENAGCVVEYDAASQTVVITTPAGEEIRCVVGSDSIQLDGLSIASDTATVIYDDRTYVPLRIVSETLGMDVQWDAEARSILITAPYQTSRVLVWSDTQPDTYGADPVLYNGQSLWVLQYASPTQAKQACETLQAQGYLASGDLYLPPVEGLSGSSLSSSDHNSWGVASSGFDDFIDTYGSRLTGPVTVAVVDTGVDGSVSALRGRVVNGYDYVDGDTDPDDEHYHGTHVASTIIDCIGSLDTSILAVRVLNSKGSGSTSQVVSGVQYAADNGADVINLSLGGPRSSSTVLDEAISDAVDRGVTVCVSAGNDSSNADYYCPSHLGTERGVVCVGAVDSNGQDAYFTNYGDAVDLKAPGVDIKAYVPGGATKTLNGTSMACPHVAAAAGLYYAFSAGLTPAQVETYLDGATNNGILDLTRAQVPTGSAPETPETPETPEKTVRSYTYSVSSLDMETGDTAQISVTAHFSDGSQQDITSSIGLISSAPEVADVSSDGTVTAKSAGQANISIASVAGIQIPAPIDVTVRDGASGGQPGGEITAYRWSTDRLDLSVNETASVQLFAVYRDGSQKDVTQNARLYVTDEAIAEVSGSQVRGLQAGSTLICFGFASTDGISTPPPLTIQVSAASQPPTQPDDTYERLFWAIKQEDTSIDSDASITSLALSKGRSVQIAIYGETRTGELVDLTDECKPYSSDPSVATLNNGRLTAVGSGSCYLWLEEIPNTDLELPPLLQLTVQ